MSILDKVVAAVTPPESDEARAGARVKAESAARSGDWLAMVLDHHRQMKPPLQLSKRRQTTAARVVAHRKLAVVLTGHSNAEESVLYPALAAADEKAHATRAMPSRLPPRSRWGFLKPFPR